MRRIFTLIFGLVTLNGFSQSPYIHKVYEYKPAPGQFVNKLPEYEPGDTEEDMRLKAEECLANDERIMISLGGYGGYVVFGFDHMVENKPGKYDFKILGNAFYANANPNADAPKEGGSCEPGIVMVSYDANGNGLPDDEWYELAGSEYYKPQTIKNYRLTYYRPDENKERIPDPKNPFLNDLTYVKWISNQGDEGYVYRNTFHNQPYYPQWLAEDELVFEGTKLANNYVDESGNGTYYVQYAYRYGYADNQPNTNDRSNFNIEWAVDKDGNSVNIPGIHFVKVYTGVNQYCGWLGETSTEVMGAEDLHLLGKDISVPVFTQSIALDKTEISLRPTETALLTATVLPQNATNKEVTWKSNNVNVATVSEGLVTAVAVGTATVRAVTNDGFLIAYCTVNVGIASGTESITDSFISVYYRNGNIHLKGAGNSNCTITSLNGSRIAQFYCTSDNEQIEKNLPRGIYILSIQKEREVWTFKIKVM